MKFKVISDGSCDLSQDLIDEYNIDVIPFYISTDGVNYKKENVELHVDEFYQQMVDNPNMYPKTSMPTTKDYMNTFEKYAKENMPSICMCITSKFSGSYNNACLARNEVLAKYPNAKIEVIDTTVNTCIQGLIVIELAKMCNEDYSFEDAIKKVNDLKSTARIFFTVGNLEYLRHGGRIGKAKGLIGATLKIKPLIILRDGEIFPLGITFTRNQSKVKVISHIKKFFDDNKVDYKDYEFVVGYGYDKEEGVQFRDKFLSVFQGAQCILAKIGATIGVHTGPYALGVGFVKKFSIN